MNVLFYRYGSICEPDIIDTFTEFGFHVTEITDEVTNKDLLPADSLKIVSRQLLSQPADFVFSINFFPHLSELCNIFHIRYLCWSVDSPVFEFFTPSIKNPWNRVFLFDRAQYNEIQPLNPACVFHLPLAANTAPKERLFSAASPDTVRKYHSDVSFVGSLYTEKCPYDKLTGISAHTEGYLNGIMAAQEKIYGCYFINELLDEALVAEFKAHLPNFYQPLPGAFLSDRDIVSQLYIGAKISASERVHTMEVLGTHFPVDLYTGSDTSKLPMVRNRGLVKTLTEMPFVFAQSKINLNITSKSIRTGLPLRIFDILSCGGFVLTNYQEELADNFEIGSDLETYGSMDELLYKTEYYLSHEKERAEIAHNGLATLKSRHTYLHRLEQMVTTAFQS